MHFFFLTSTVPISFYFKDNMWSYVCIEQVHTVRLWAEGKARQLSNMWNMDQFFRVTQVDVTSSITALEKRHVRYIITGNKKWIANIISL